MPLLKTLILYLLTVPIFFAIDLVWLGVVARGLYKKRLAHVLNPQVNWPAALIFYLIFIIGILVFAVLPALEKGRAGHALLMGGLFGFFTYATYDLTNLATLKDWPILIVVVDIAWGVVLCGVVAALSFLAGRGLLGA